MKNILTSFLALLGLASACGQHNFENANVDRFAECITDSNVVLLDVRTEKEFNEGHIQNALNIDIKQDDFVEKAKATLPTEKTVAVYCRSGVRSALAANKLSAEGYKVVNLEGGILAQIPRLGPCLHPHRIRRKGNHDRPCDKTGRQDHRLHNHA